MPDSDFTLTWLLPDGASLSTPGFSRLNLLAIADTFDLELPQKCGGHAECGTCRVRIHTGDLTPPRHEERALMAHHAARFQANERLACQCRPLGPCTIEVLARIPPDLRDLP